MNHCNLALKSQKMSRCQSSTNSRSFKHFFKNSRTFKHFFINSRSFKHFFINSRTFKHFFIKSRSFKHFFINSRSFKHFFINSRTFKALNFCFQIQAHLSRFKFCANPVIRTPVTSAEVVLVLFKYYAGN